MSFWKNKESPILTEPKTFDEAEKMYLRANFLLEGIITQMNSTLEYIDEARYLMDVLRNFYAEHCDVKDDTTNE